jgi:beta-phosphoglucomutase-like phosphatase (HAD superfamily)
MSKAFIFDFDGVIINNEPIWEDVKKELYQNVFGKEVFLQMGSTLGINMDDIYEKAVQCGTDVKKDFFIREFHSKAPVIYKEAPLTSGIDSIGKTLTDLGYKIAIVSASPTEWIETTLNRTRFKDYVSHILSLYDRKDLPHKPAPDGYLEAMKTLGVSPHETVILEDSNTGIDSAKASGAYAIGFRQNLMEGYVQKNADAYADNLEDVITILKKMNTPRLNTK